MKRRHRRRRHNPYGNPRHHARRRRHRRNPAIPYKGLGVAALGGAVIGGIAYALGMTELGDGARAAITAGAGAVLGGVTAMASPMAGAGIAGAGIGIGVKEGIGIAMAPKATQQQTQTKSMQRVVSLEQLDAVVDRRVAQLMQARNATPTIDRMARQRVG